MYAQVDVIVAGALDESATYFDETLLDEYLGELERAAEGDGYRYEVFVLWHDHGIDVDECACAQYVTDHRPTYVYNPDGNV